MPADVLSRSVGFSLGSIEAALLVTTRLAGLFVFFPLPGAKSVASLAKIVFALSLTVALYPFWPKLQATESPMQLAAWALAESALGLAMGLTVAFLAEGVTLAMQIVAGQAGYSYASSIDPNSEADSGVLPVLGQLFASLLFFAIGLDGQLIRALAGSLETLPPGGDWNVLGPGSAGAVLRLPATLFSTALRLALPVAALLLILDLALALMGRINAQLQLLSVAFPAKMLLTLAMLAALAPAAALVYQSQGAVAMSALERLLAATPRALPPAPPR
ncbi:MAG: flagellar biosynthetic protein FliR [Bryobacteraceae bacterium]|nr:flagellar biosynthetic protein FliR [Bryobacteraceae bacterium]